MHFPLTGSLSLSPVTAPFEQDVYIFINLGFPTFSLRRNANEPVSRHRSHSCLVPSTVFSA